jgi:hypothetical protein
MDLSGIAQVADRGIGSASAAADHLDGLGGSGRIEIVHHDISAIGREAQGDRPTDATASSGNQGPAASEHERFSHFTAPNVRPLTR